MAIPVIMPKQGQSVETCIITKWFRQAGEHVKAGDILFSYETDKASFDHESPIDGTILEIIHPEGSEVPVLSPVAILGSPGETIGSSDLNSMIPAETRTEEAIKVTRQESVQTHTATPQSTGTDELKIRISPRARNIADKNKINYTNIRGSGPLGRILVRDIMDAMKSPVAESMTSPEAGKDYTDNPLSNVRKLIAKSMHASLMNSAQLTHHMSADVRRLLDVRQAVKKKITSGALMQDITLNDMICYCVVKALHKFPEVNSHFNDEFIRTFSRVHLGIAVDTPRGLLVPVVKNADGMDLVELSRSLKAAAENCRRGNIDPELIKSTAATFTVSNLGNYGVEMFTPVINLPQSAILGVCTIIHRPADLGNNTYGFVPFIGLSLTYDHRAIDGGPATLFLKEIKNEIENFSFEV